MAKKYIKNSSGVYVKPFYYRFGFWFLFILSFLLLFLALNYAFISLFNIRFKVFVFFIILLAVVLFVYCIVLSFLFLKTKKKYKSFKDMFQSKKLEKSIISNFIDTMSVNKMLSTKYIRIPSANVDLSTVADGYITVVIERLAGMNDLDLLIKNVNNAFRGKFKDYAIVTFIESLDGLKYSFKLENVNIDKTLIPQNIEDFIIPNNYIFKLQKGLNWNISKQPHAIITGKTGSGKSTLLLSLLMQILYKGLDLTIIDPKNEFSAFNFLENEIYSQKEEVFNVLDFLIDELENRQKEIKNMVVSTSKIGGSAADFDIRPRIIIIDEMSAFVAGLDSKEKKLFDSYITQIVQKGRSLGFCLIVAMQNANAETIKVAVRNQFSLRILLGNGSNEDLRFMFGSNTDNIVNLDRKFMGWYFLDSISLQPEKFYIPNIHLNNLNKLDYYKSIYKKGRK